METKLVGLEALESELEQKFGRKGRTEMIDNALKIGAKVIVEYMKSQMSSFERTGASIDEITIIEPEWILGERTVRIAWRGPHDRYRIIHLNEKGHYDRSGKWVETKGKGAIDRALRQGREAYFNAIKIYLEGVI